MLPLAVKTARVLSNSINTQGRSKKIFKLGTFNVRGLTKEVKQNQLSTDVNKYGLDVACIQETKMKILLNKEVNRNQLICTESVSGHYGLGFMVSSKWKDHIYRFWRVNDRLSVLQLRTDQSNEKPTEKYSSVLKETVNPVLKKDAVDHMVNIINVYAPTSEKVEKDSKEVENLYSEINKLMDNFRKMKSSITFVAGDFNAKVGRQMNEETCVGKHSKGERNQSGQLLTDFCERSELYLSNTSFQHPVRHITTWSQQRVEKRTGTVKCVNNQIDYILMDVNKKHCLMNARSYAGTETYSDHRLVIAKIQADWTSLYKKINNKKKQEVKNKINIHRLVTDEDARKEYAAKISEQINILESWEEINEVCDNTAAETLGYVEKEGKKGEIYNEEIKIMSQQQKDIRLRMSSEKDTKQLQQLREERSKIQRTMTKEIKLIREKEVDEIVEEIEKTKDDARMFKAVKKIDRKSFENPVVHDKDGKNVVEPQQMYGIVREHFQSQFFEKDQEEVVRFVGQPKPLNRPITATEVAKAVAAMSNGKASNGPAVELVKYGPHDLHRKIAEVLNNLFSKHEDINTGASLLIPLQKPPPKKKGPVKNLRPINLLPVIRKILSKIGLKRAEEELNNYLSHTQSAYRTGRATTDIVWGYRWILAKIQEYDLTLYVTGIDMSSAFDTMERNKLLDIVGEFMCEDNQRIMRILLSDTSVEIQIKGAETSAFKSNIGGPQGDSYSGPQFTTYFENSLKAVREECDIDLNEDYPVEIIYADDYDNITLDQQKKRVFKENVKEILGRDNLLVNEDKTEDTVLKRNKHDRKNKLTNEPWRDTIKLGSKLGDKEDIARRKQLSRVKLIQMKKIQKRKHVVSLKKKLKLYNTLVKSVLTYNSCTWGLTTQDEKNLDSFHRQQLRQVAGIFYPNKIGNIKLYKLTETRPLSIDITRSRWKMFGHVLRLNENTPARKAMKWFFQVPVGCKKFRGRKRATIVTTLNRDIERTRQQNTNFTLPNLNSELDLRNIRVKALNRKYWQKLVKMVTDAAYSDCVI